MSKDKHRSDTDADAESSRLNAARSAAGGAYETVKKSAGEGLETTKATMSSAYHATLDKTEAVYEAAREKTGHAYSSARDAASDVRERTAAGIEENPLAALIGGIALGVIAGAFIPRSQREIEALAPVGDRIRSAAGSAATAAKAAAFDKIAELGLSKDNLVAKGKTVMSEAATAAQETGSAAAEAARNEAHS